MITHSGSDRTIYIIQQPFLRNGRCSHSVPNGLIEDQKLISYPTATMSFNDKVAPVIANEHCQMMHEKGQAFRRNYRDAFRLHRALKMSGLRNPETDFELRRLEACMKFNCGWISFCDERVQLRGEPQFANVYSSLHTIDCQVAHRNANIKASYQ